MTESSTPANGSVPELPAKEIPPRDKTMSLWGHLTELRNRFAIAAVGFIVAMIVGFIIAEPVIEFLYEPVRIVQEARPDSIVGFNYSGIAGPFNQRLRIAFTLGFFLSAPIWLWQLWAFVMPGLTRKEIKYTVGFAAAAIPLFFGGIYIGTLVLPRIVDIMASFTPQDGSNLFDAQTYYDFVFKLFLAIGIAMVLPVFIVALNLAGVLSAKSIIKSWRWAFLICLLFSALATPAADIVSMFLLTAIFFGLYLIAAGIAWFVDRRRAKKALKAAAV